MTDAPTFDRAYLEECRRRGREVRPSEDSDSTANELFDVLEDSIKATRGLRSKAALIVETLAGTTPADRRDGYAAAWAAYDAVAKAEKSLVSLRDMGLEQYNALMEAVPDELAGQIDLEDYL